MNAEVIFKSQPRNYGDIVTRNILLYLLAGIGLVFLFGQKVLTFVVCALVLRLLYEVFINIGKEFKTYIHSIFFKNDSILVEYQLYTQNYSLSLYPNEISLAVRFDKWSAKRTPYLEVECDGVLLKQYTIKDWTEAEMLRVLDSINRLKMGEIAND